MKTLIVVAILGGALSLSTSGCAHAARIEIRPENPAAVSVGAEKERMDLDRFLRTLGYIPESESTNEATRRHGAYWKGLPAVDGESLIEIWYRETKNAGPLRGWAKMEVRLLQNRNGSAVAVFCENPSWEDDMDRDARAIKSYLESSYPSFNITVQFWTPVDM